MRVVVVGAGPSGTRCAERAAERGLSVTLIGAEPAHPYNRVALSKLLAGEMSEEELVTHGPERLAALGVAYRDDTRIAAIDRAARTLRAASDEVIAYDRLVLATGAQAFRLPLPGADLPGVLMYRTLDEVRAMLHATSRGGRAVVIGGGLLGLEAAYGLAQRGMHVTVVHAVDRLMERQLDAAASLLLARRLAGMGMEVVLGAVTKAITGETQANGIALSDGRHIETDLVVMAVGIRPETTLARAAGLEVARAIVVDDAMVTSDPAILAIGECAEHRGICIGLVAPAYEQAEIAARVLAGEDVSYVARADATALKVAGAGVWSGGEIDCADADVIVYDDPEAGEYKKFLVRGNRLVGAMAYGETAHAPWYHTLMAEGRDVGALRSILPFGPAYAPTELAA